MLRISKWGKMGGSLLLSLMMLGGAAGVASMAAQRVLAKSAPLKTKRIELADSPIGTRLVNRRGLKLNISVGARPMITLRNRRGLTMMLGPVPQAIQSATAAQRRTNGAGGWWMVLE